MTSFHQTGPAAMEAMAVEANLNPSTDGAISPVIKEMFYDANGANGVFVPQGARLNFVEISAGEVTTSLFYH
jgi:hypothetical protein